MKQSERRFDAPNWVARVVNRFYGWLTSRGLGPSYSFELQVVGRRTGKIYSTPVNILRFGEQIFLVGTRGHTQWSRNARAVEQVTLKRGRIILRFRLREVTDQEKPEILKAYLTRFGWMVRRFFPLPPRAPSSAFASIAAGYPVFELLSENSSQKSERNQG
ncbi:MAG TPA: nitroreductase family deazaflavin-dependent oxidoreductase [Terriglobales bacterium]|jgi:deazaflavin-dependent oxidoreductase (nitroreductase family)|nr:nitroreductase family deazaflavin-dependent oxidoreductase [Terriglobales bacterium]